METISYTLRKPIFFLFLLVCGHYNIAQIKKSDWTSYNALKERPSQNFLFGKLPTKYSIWELSTTNFSKKSVSNNVLEVILPSPDGRFETFTITPSKVIADEVAHLYTIRTFTGYKKENPSALISCDMSSSGFHAAVYDEDESFFIEPLFKDNSDVLISYYKKDYISDKLTCKTQTNYVREVINNNIDLRAPTTKRTYRLAIAAAGEYSQQFGGNPYSTSNVLDALASGVNMINPIFLRDLGVAFTLVSTDALVYPDPNTDPFNMGDDVAAAHDACTNALGSGGFDLGHMVMWSNTGGAAYFGVVCNDASKGGGFSGSSNSTTTLWVDYVAHEIGHQFRSAHNFVSQECGTSADNFRYEPGEGSSIMSYANVCQGAAQYASGSDPFFHYASIAQMQSFLNTISCQVEDVSGNTSAPVTNANADITIPKQTPFILVGNGSDANDSTNSLTYDWVQYDGSSQAVIGSPDCNSTNAPMFRYRPPTPNNYRSFPQYSDILAGNNNQQWEKLPCSARTMNFSLTVRDNNTSFGRIGEDKTTVTVANTGPFNVTSPNGGETLTGNENFTVTWTVNGTDAHCTHVDILVSTDGGNTYTLISDATANDGIEVINVPNIASTTARVLIQCDVSGGFRSASTFFDISNDNFSINEGSLSIDDTDALGISIYPNPASNQVHIKLTDTYKYTYNLVDLRGRTILEGAFNESTSILTNGIQSGLYLLVLQQENSNRRIVRKLIVHH